MEASRIAIDADIFIDHLRQSSTVLIRVLQDYSCVVSAITIYELHAVQSLSERQQALVDRLLAPVETLPFTAVAAERAAVIWRALSAQGKLIGLADIFLAGSCLSGGLPLLTRNTDHFSRIDGLTLISSDQLSS